MTTLSCEAIRERLADGDQDETLLAHARTCAECQPILAALDGLDDELAQLPTIDAPEALVQSTLDRVRAEATSEATDATPSLLGAAFAVLTSAIGALLTAPLVALRWLLGVGAAPAAAKTERPRRSWPLAPTLAFGTLVVLIGLTTWTRLGVTVKSKIRGADGVMAGLPVAPSTPAYGGRFDDLPASGEVEEQLAEPTAPVVATAPADALDDEMNGDFWRTTGEPPAQRGLGQGFETAEDGEADTGGAAHGRTVALDETTARQLAALAYGGNGELAGAQTPDGDQRELPPAATTSTTTLEDDGEIANARDDDGREAGAWAFAQATSGLTFAPSEGWWSNTYVPGDARLRVLHARLAAASTPLPGATMSALSLAELASPTVPAVAAPTDRALALGVHADTTAVEGPTRVRMEIALRAIEESAGRRGALRIALVVDARSGLDAAATEHLRSLIAALTRSLSPRDRVILTAAGAGGGTLVPLGVLRHGPIEVALRHLDEASHGAMAGEAIVTSLEDALAAGLEAVADVDDAAGLVLLATPDGAHDAGVDRALHLGAVAGVPTTAVGIGTAARTADLDAIALAGEGRRRAVLGDEDAARVVREELAAASRLVARALRVRVRLAEGVQLVDVVGAHALDAEETQRTRESERAIDQELARRLGIGQDRDDDDSGLRVLVPSFYAGDAHTIVLDLLVSRPGAVADVDVRFKDMVRLGNGTVSSALTLEAGHAPRGPHELRVVASYVGHEVATALDAAADAMERGDVRGAHDRLAEARAMLGQARDAVGGLGSVPSIAADATLLDRFLAAVDATSDVRLLASSLHYAAARRVVTPQLQASTP